MYVPPLVLHVLSRACEFPAIRNNVSLLSRQPLRLLHFCGTLCLSKHGDLAAFHLSRVIALRLHVYDRRFRSRPGVDVDARLVPINSRGDIARALKSNTPWTDYLPTGAWLVLDHGEHFHYIVPLGAFPRHTTGTRSFQRGHASPFSTIQQARAAI